MTPTVTTRDVARAVGTSSLSRFAAVIEVVTTPALTWLFGVPAYGVYTVLSAAVTLGAGSIDLAMPTVLQRVVPQAKDEAEALGAVKWAMVLGVLPSLLIAVAISLAAAPVAAAINAAPADRAVLALAVGLFGWALPLTSLVEVATAAVRARRAFGPEIRLRVFWEQLTRLGLAVLLWATWRGNGHAVMALAVAHLASLVVVAALSLRLVARFYDLGGVRRAPLHWSLGRAMLGFGITIMPANALRRALTDLPPILLNRWLPGAAGATAAGLYGIARKLSSIPQLVRTVFAYVIAPLASAQAATDRAAVAPLYGFATRLATAVALPLSATIIGLGEPLLRLFAPQAAAALPLLLLLVTARALEAVAGPASAVIEIIGHRLRPTLNALLGLVTWLGLAWWLVPDFGSTGMAAAVGAAIVLSGWVAVIELRFGDGLDPFAPPYLRTLAIAGSGSLVTAALGLYPGGWLVAPLLGLATLWTALRFGLSGVDREALGATGRRLRLVRSA